MAANLRPLSTYARLHEAEPDDEDGLWRLSSGLPGAAGGMRPSWPQLMRARGATVLVATECQLVVGACVTWQQDDQRRASLAWLGVARDARHRGIGHLLIEAAMSRASLGGAMAMSAHLPAGADELRDLLDSLGFTGQADGEMAVALGR